VNDLLLAKLSEANRARRAWLDHPNGPEHNEENERLRREYEKAARHFVNYSLGWYAGELAEWEASNV
jgi:hypothetical protein